MSGSVEQSVRSAVPVADLSALDAALAQGDEVVRETLRRLRPSDVGRDLSRRDVAEARRIVGLSDDRRAAATVRAAHPGVAAQVVETLDPQRLGRVLGFLPSDHQVGILGAMDDEVRSRVEAALSPAEKTYAERVLAFPESAVARLMTSRIWRVAEDVTVGDAIDLLRERADAIEVAQNCYVVNDLGRLRGVAALRDLAVADPARPIKELMREDVIAVREESSKGDAAEIIQAHDFLSLPVIDEKGNLVGAVRVDDLLDAALSRGGVGALNQGGVAGSVAAQVPYFQTSMVRVVRSRVTWLVLLFVAETATGTVLRHFEHSLQRVVALSFFIPLLIGTGGNAGSQTVSTVIRALALGEVRLKDTLRVLWKEASTGLVLGLLLGTIAFVRAQMWGVPMDVAGCVGLTVLVVCAWANTVGSLIPLGAQRVGIDPTVVSGPLITTLVDASGLFLYLTIAHAMVAQLRGN